MGVLDRFWTDLLARHDGPLSFRFILQPIMAILAAWRDGKKDAETGRSPYFWTVLTNPQKRAGRLREGLKSTSKILAMGLVIDLIYQTIVFDTIRPMEAVVIAIVLAFVPYMLVRGTVVRWAAWRRGRKSNVE
ncbi:hypothetical protein EKL30_03465 [Candidimonas sp. SYP-B2681]|nr:hypothetical protein EKL30_03465 [Candidimonas sp. SYP-B2681]